MTTWNPPLLPRRAFAVATLVALGAGAADASCAAPIDDKVVMGTPDDASADTPPPPVFTQVDDAGDAGDVVTVDAPPPVYACVSSECAAPYATCPSSQSLCDINLLTDPNHCGTCDVACPSDPWISYELGAKWDCIQGKCQMLCTDSLHRDCDGFVENGCETTVDTVQNCGNCGAACPDGYACDSYTRTCYDPRCLAPAVTCGAACVDTNSDDYNCGACNTVCNQYPRDASAPPFGMYYGCKNATCETLKCAPSFEDCDHDEQKNGCEINIASDEDNCGACGVKCPAGDLCQAGKCVCDPGPDGCGCTDLTSDVENCGSCGYGCPGSDQGGNGKRTCKGGHCGYECAEGYADCNNDRSDGCEVNLRRDPQHCGSCKEACTTGQSCKDSVCATKPCSDGPVK